MDSFIKFFIELKNRWGSKTPDFFVTLRKIWLFITALAGVVATLSSQQINVLQKFIPATTVEVIQSAAEIIGLISLALAAQTRLAVKDGSVQKDLDDLK